MQKWTESGLFTSKNWNVVIFVCDNELTATIFNSDQNICNIQNSYRVNKMQALCFKTRNDSVVCIVGIITFVVIMECYYWYPSQRQIGVTPKIDLDMLL